MKTNRRDLMLWVAVACSALAIDTPAKASISNVWAAAGVGRPAGRVDWGLNWGTIYRDGNSPVNADLAGAADAMRDVSLILAEASNEIYEPGGGNLTKLGLKNLGYVEVDSGRIDSAAVVGYSAPSPRAEPAIVVSVRGSESNNDWLIDFVAVPTRSGDDMIHLGFLTYASTLYGEVGDILEPYCRDGKTRIWLTGHSMGGTAAQILAYWLAQDGCSVQGVVTFGSPRAGLAGSFGENYEEIAGGKLGYNTHRFEHESDPVTCLPSGDAWAKVGVRHVVYGTPPEDDEDVPYQVILTGATPFAHANDEASICRSSRLPTLIDDVTNVATRSFNAHRMTKSYLPALYQTTGPLHRVGR